MTLTLDAINAMDEPAFVAALGDIFEHAPWAAERAAGLRPFASVTDLHMAMFNAVRGQNPGQRLAFFNNHPDLGGAMARARAMTTASNSEQGGLGLDRLDETRFARFQEMNTAYHTRFGFPFILCVRRHTRASVLRNFERRLKRDLATERDAAMHEIFLITRLRVADRVSGPGMPQVHGRLSTHVLDTTTGQPAAGVPIALYELDADAALPLAGTATNADGRTDAPLLSGAPLRIGQYELRFDIRAHFARTGAALANPPYFDIIPIRFAIAEPEAHYHVPLLASPWSYTTYRGS
jgi:2-oxo-4-hydroxy-4-carboxy-5-ureidoimidazoline decarboxylase